MPLRGVRGATTATENTEQAILSATQALLEEMVAANGIRAEDVAAAFFTLTPDLNAAFPAQAARQLGWYDVPLMDACEIPVPNSLDRCIRVLVLWNTSSSQGEIAHIYKGEARTLRPDLVRERKEGR